MCLNFRMEGHTKFERAQNMDCNNHVWNFMLCRGNSSRMTFCFKATVTKLSNTYILMHVTLTQIDLNASVSTQLMTQPQIQIQICIQRNHLMFNKKYTEAI